MMCLFYISVFVGNSKLWFDATKESLQEQHTVMKPCSLHLKLLEMAPPYGRSPEALGYRQRPYEGIVMEKCLCRVKFAWETEKRCLRMNRKENWSFIFSLWRKHSSG